MGWCHLSQCNYWKYFAKYMASQNYGGATLVYRNVPTTNLVRPLAIVEHSVVSVTSNKHWFVMVISWYSPLGYFDNGPSEDEFLPRSLIAVPNINKRVVVAIWQVLDLSKSSSGKVTLGSKIIECILEKKTYNSLWPCNPTLNLSGRVSGSSKG